MLKKSISAIALALAFILGGCAVQRADVSREDWKTRSYEGISKGDIIDAAREVIRLADPDEVIQIKPTPDGFSAIRYQQSYYVVETGLDAFEFEFTARERSGGEVEARLDITETIMRANLLTLGLPIGETGKPQSDYIYRLFYSRMDYLLGLSDRWDTCKDSGVTTPKKAEQLGLAAFCGRFADDLAPPPFRKRS